MVTITVTKSLVHENHHELSDDTPRSWCGGGNVFGGQDVDGENTYNSAMDSLAPSVGGTNQLTLTNRVSERSMAGWP